MPQARASANTIPKGSSSANGIAKPQRSQQFSFLQDLIASHAASHDSTVTVDIWGSFLANEPGPFALHTLLRETMT